MACRHGEFVELGKSFNKPECTEVHWRTGINRCYYGLYLRLRAYARFLERPPSVAAGPTGPHIKHDELCLMVENWSVAHGFPRKLAQHKDAAGRAGRELRALMSLRKRADYRPHDDVRKSDLEACILRAENISRFADAVDSDA